MNTPVAQKSAWEVGARPAPISAAERAARIEKAQRRMRELGFSALVTEAGTSLTYFTGIQLRRSERPTCAVIPAEGEIAVITPYFEEASVREALATPAEVRTWLEYEDALAVLGGWLRDRGLASSVIGLEDTTRLFVVERLRRSVPSATLRDGGAVFRECRAIKSPAEIALMQHAADITIAAFRRTIPRIDAGMAPAQIQAMMKQAHIDLGGAPVFEDVLIGKAAADPHGSDQAQVVRAGEIVLMDCGCSVEGYQSDITRTFVFGTPTPRHREVWDQVSAGQRVALAAAAVGVAAGDVDRAVRGYYESLGYGPDHGLPGLSHRTGHGIGLDLHEAIYLVKNATETLSPGMCFSNEPGIYIPGEFGIRLEDCFYMTPEGPRWFSTPSASIEQPV